MKTVILSLMFAFAGSAMAQTAGNGYYQLQPMQVTEVSHEVLSKRNFTDMGIGSEACTADPGSRFLTLTPAGGFTAANFVIDQVMNIGKKIWSVIELGQPVTNIQTDVATALPAGAKCWQNLQTWSSPEARTYSVSFKNIYNMEVVRFAYRVVYLPGGSVNGKGHYVGYATLQPSDVYVAWGYKFNAEASAPAVFNMGTKEDPVGALTLNMKFSVDTIVNHLEQTQAYNVNGKGEFKKLD